MNKEFIKRQMEIVGISKNRLKDITGVGYATINDFFNKDVYNIKAENYLKIVNELFTPFEQLLYANACEKSIGSKYDIEYWYDELVKRKVKQAFETGKIDIKKSGGVISDDNGILRQVPAHLIVTFKDVEGNSYIRIFDGETYRNSNKKEAVKQYFGIEYYTSI